MVIRSVKYALQMSKINRRGLKARKEIEDNIIWTRRSCQMRSTSQSRQRKRWSWTKSWRRRPLPIDPQRCSRKPHQTLTQVVSARSLTWSQIYSLKTVPPTRTRVSILTLPYSPLSARNRRWSGSTREHWLLSLLKSQMVVQPVRTWRRFRIASSSWR